jgi:predicted PurR-regulated permease PerM
VPGYALTATNVVVQLFIVLVLAYLMTAEKEFSERLVLRFVRARHRPRARRLVSAWGHSLGRWALGAILLALYFGVVFGAGLKVAGIPYAITLGAVGAVLEIIPYVGGVITMMIAALAAGTKGLLYVGIAVGWYAVVAEVEAHIVHPWLVGRVVRLHPIIIALALFVGGEGFGFLGLLLSVPAALVLKVVLDEFYPPDPPASQEQASSRPHTSS